MKKWILLAVAVVFIACNDTQSSTKEAPQSQSITTNADSNKTAIDSNKVAESNIAAESTTNTKNTAQTLSSDSTKAKTPQELYKKCIACHGAKGDKIPPGSATNIVIADLSKKNLSDDLKGYRAKTLSKGGTAAIMYLQANGLSDEDIETLSQYITTFKK